MGMIDAKQAKEILSCDDAALKQHIDSGAIKAQRQGGKLLLDADDVNRMAKKEEEEGTIVLTGESDNLQIDLGKVVDDSSETIVQAKASPSAQDSQQITFGEDLEVVSLDDSKTQDLEQTTKQTTTAKGLSFTDSNTAVITSVEETHVGATTAPIETGNYPAGPNGGLPTGESGRRSVRSSRRLPENEVKVPWYWMFVAALAFVVSIFFIAPYYVIGLTPTVGEKDHGGNILRGTNDNTWTNMAASIAGHAVEPDFEKWKKAGNTDPTAFIDISKVDSQAQWRFRAYRENLNGENERIESFVIVKVSDDGNKATAKKGGKEYPIVTKTLKVENGPELKPIEVQVWADSK